VAGVQTRIVSGLLLGNPRIKNHSDVGVAEKRREYYMGKGGGFTQVQAVVSLVSPKLPVACPRIYIYILPYGQFMIWFSFKMEHICPINSYNDDQN
jgi:hypothetical protein